MKTKILNFINKFQQYFKIDFFYLIKGGSWLTAGRLINVFAAFLLSLAWANWIDKETFGNYQYILSLVGIISIFSLPEMDTAVTQAVARKFEGSFIRGFKVQLKWGILGSLSALFIAGYYWIQNNQNLSSCFLIVALFLPLFNASLIYLGLLTGRKLFDIQVKYDAITQLIATAIMILTLFFIKEFLLGVPIYIILCLIIFIYFLSRTLLRTFFLVITNLKFKPNKKEDTKTIGFGIKLSFSGIIDSLTGNLDKILLFHYLGAIDLAIYSFAKLVPEQIRFFLIRPINLMSLPNFSVRSQKELKKTIFKKIYYWTVLISIFVLIYILLAPFVFQIFFPKYLSAVPYSQLYALSIIPLSFPIIGNIFKAKMMLKQIYQLKIIPSIIRAGLFLILIPLFGIWGAILGVVLARIFNAFFISILFKTTNKEN